MCFDFYWLGVDFDWIFLIWHGFFRFGYFSWFGMDFCGLAWIFVIFVIRCGFLLFPRSLWFGMDFADSCDFGDSAWILLVLVVNDQKTRKRCQPRILIEKALGFPPRVRRLGSKFFNLFEKHCILRKQSFLAALARRNACIDWISNAQSYFEPMLRKQGSYGSSPVEAKVTPVRSVMAGIYRNSPGLMPRAC